MSNEILSTHSKIMVNGECNKHKPLLAMVKLRACTCIYSLLAMVNGKVESMYMYLQLMVNGYQILYERIWYLQHCCGVPCLSGYCKKSA